MTLRENNVPDPKKPVRTVAGTRGSPPLIVFLSQPSIGSSATIVVVVFVSAIALMIAIVLESRVVGGLLHNFVPPSRF